MKINDFFGYYDKSPWDSSDRYMLCMRANDTWSDVSPREKADILLIDTSLPETDKNRVKKIAETSSWNVQQSCMLQWLGPDFSSHILFNDYRDEKYEQSVVMLAMVKDERLHLDAQRYLINNYLLLDQKNKLISSWNKLIWDRNLTASDFYTYFYEAFYHPYSEWKEFQLYAYDTELANKMIRACWLILPENERVVCTYWTIGRNIAMWLFDWLEQYLLSLVAEYPQWYLYHALWEYYVQEWNLEKAKLYLLKAVSLTQKWTEINQIKKLLQDTM